MYKIALILFILAYQSLSAQRVDSLCYDIPTASKIAVALVEGKECDALLKVEKLESSKKDTAIHNLQTQKINLETSLALKDRINANQAQELRQVKTYWYITLGVLVLTFLKF